MPVLGYWPIRGLAQSIRYLMYYVGQPYEEKYYYQIGPGPDYDKTEWLNAKFALKMDFPNLPYYIEEEAGVRLTQSKAIMKYVARKYNLVAQTDAEFNRQEMILFESTDLHGGFISLAYNPDFEKIRADYLKALPDKLKMYEQFLGDRPFFVGNKVNYADFNVYEALYVHVVLEPKCLDSFPKLKAFMKRIEELPGVKEFIQSKDHIREPIFSRTAYFSNGN